jgi:hypothetical protein
VDHGGKQRAKPLPPELDGSVAEVDTSLVQKILDVPERQSNLDEKRHARWMVSGSLRKWPNGSNLMLDG